MQDTRHLNSESALLGILLNNPDMLDRVFNADILWKDEKNEQIFQMLIGLASTCENYTKIMIVQKSIERQMDVNYIEKVYRYEYDPDKLSYYLDNMKKRTMLLKLRAFISQKNDMGLSALKDEIHKISESYVESNEKELENTNQDCMTLAEKINNKQKPDVILSGIEWFDQNQEGWEAPTYIVIGAAQSVGKTSLAINSTVQQLRHGVPVGFISCEMTREKVYELMAANVAGVDSKRIQMRILTNEDTSRLVHAIEKLYDKPLYIDDSTRYLDAIVRKIKILNKKGVRVFYIDYLQYLRTRKPKNQYERLEEISNTLKELSKSLKICIICIASLNRIGKDGSEDPKSHHIKGNGDIEYDADVIMLLKRIDTNSEDGVRIIEGIVDKNRNGELARFKMRYKPATRQFKLMTKLEEMEMGNDKE